MSSNQQSTGPGGSKIVLGIGLLLVLAGVAIGAILLHKKGKAEAEANRNAQAAEAAGGTVVAKGDFAPVIGRWYRADGGYVLDITQAEADGKLTAAYYNPRPINVSKANASKEGSLVKVMVELRDTGYPGCLYTLLYDKDKDTLRGNYFQAAMGETYDVSFERVKE